MNKYYLLLLLVLASCSSNIEIPKEKFNVVQVDLDEDLKGDSLIITLRNLIPCPVRIYARSRDAKYQHLLTDFDPFLLDGMQYKTIILQDSSLNLTDLKGKIRYTGTMGDLDAPISDMIYRLPFPKGRKYRIMQGYNGSFSHTSAFSRYALDFNLAIGDTICAAADGVVVSEVDAYTLSANDKRLRDYANFVTLFHPEANTYTQYVHIKHAACLVEIGDSIKVGQPIALSGDVGYVDGAHLHFNVLKPIESVKGMASMPIEFEGGVKGEQLRKNVIIGH